MSKIRFKNRNSPCTSAGRFIRTNYWRSQLCSANTSSLQRPFSYARATSAMLSQSRPKPARRACFSDSWARACWPLHQCGEDCNAAPSRPTPSTKIQRYCLGVKSGWIRDAASGTICASCINPCSLVAWKKIGVSGVRIAYASGGGWEWMLHTFSCTSGPQNS